MYSKKIEDLTARPVYLPKQMSQQIINMKLSSLESLPSIPVFGKEHKGKHIRLSPDGKVATG